MTRRWLRAVTGGLVSLLLFAQLSIAAYACPGGAGAAAADDAPPIAQSLATATGVDTGMPNCDDAVGGMDPEFANLCAEHCKQGKQSDQAPTLNVPAALLTALYTTPPSTPPDRALRAARITPSALVVASPPHAILHCVFRI